MKVYNEITLNVELTQGNYLKLPMNMEQRKVFKYFVNMTGLWYIFWFLNDV